MEEIKVNESGFDKYPEVFGAWYKNYKKGDENIEGIIVSKEYDKAIYTYKNGKNEIKVIYFYLMSKDDKVTLEFDNNKHEFDKLFSLRILIKEENKVMIMVDDSKLYKLLGKYSLNGFRMLLYFEMESLASCIYVDTDEFPNIINFSDIPKLDNTNKIVSESKKMFELIAKLSRWKEIEDKECENDELKESNMEENEW